MLSAPVLNPAGKGLAMVHHHTPDRDRPEHLNQPAVMIRVAGVAGMVGPWVWWAISEASIQARRTTTNLACSRVADARKGTKDG